MSNCMAVPTVEVSDNKLIISSPAKELMSAKRGDRITVNYIQENNEKIIPVIGKAEVFIDPNAGNKLTKSNTVSFKGIQKIILTKYGQLFEIEKYKLGIFKMIPIKRVDHFYVEHI